MPIQPGARLAAISAVLFASAAAHAAKDAYKISGYVGRSSTEAASGVTVKLLDAESGKLLDSVRTGFTGRYKFENLKPGRYILQANELQLEALLKSKDLRLDIDLSAKDGAMSYLEAKDVQKLASAAAAGAAGGSGAAPPAGPGDPELVARFAGNYWGFSGSTERSLVLCPGGTFSEQSESGYSGSSRDSLGSQTIAWGTATQGGSRGNWSIQGGARQGRIRLSYPGGRQAELTYRQVDDGCFNFSGNTLCRKGAAPCK